MSRIPLPFLQPGCRRAAPAARETGGPNRTLAVVLVLLVCAAPLRAQAPPAGFVVPATNPPAVVEERISATEVEIRYSRPSVKGRAIFGALVPHGQVWRTGADNATTIRFGTEVSFGGARVEAGTYELFTIPDPAAWTVILQKSRGQWGSYAYDPVNDAVRVSSRPTSLAERVETLTIGLGDLRPSSAALQISWDRTRVAVPIVVDIRATTLPAIEAALRAEGKKPYFRAAMFYFENELDIDRAAELIALAVEQSPRHLGILHRQALILEKKGDRAGAIAAAEASLAEARKAEKELREEYTRLNGALLERLRSE